MTYGVTTTTSPATSAVIQPSQNSAPESKAKTDTVPSIPRADHLKTGKSLTAEMTVSITEAKADMMLHLREQMVNEAMAENQKLIRPVHELMRNSQGIYSISDSEVTEVDVAVAKEWLSSLGKK